MKKQHKSNPTSTPSTTTETKTTPPSPSPATQGPPDEPSKTDVVEAHLRETKGVARAIDTLLECLGATRTHWDTQKKEWVSEPDTKARLAAAQLLLSYGVGNPVKRQEIVTTQAPQAAPEPSALIESIDRKIAELLNRKDLTLPQLVAAKKQVEQSRKKAKATPMTEEEYTNRARRIHGLPPLGCGHDDDFPQPGNLALLASEQ